MKTNRRTQIAVNIVALYLACRDPRVPWTAKALAAAVVAYAFSPLDLIPDFIPVLGQLDDLLLLPIGVYLALRLIPAAVWEECRAQAQHELDSGKRVNWAMGIAIVMLWLVALVAVARLLEPALSVWWTG